METLFCGSLMVTFDSRRSDRCGFPRRLHEGHNEIFANECAEQSHLVGQNGGKSFGYRLALDLSAEALEPVERASLAIPWNDIHEPWELGRGDMNSAGEKRGDSGGAEQGMQPPTKTVAQQVEGGGELRPIRRRLTSRAGKRVHDETPELWRA